MDDRNIIAAILALATDDPQLVFNRYEQYQELLAEKNKRDLPEGTKNVLAELEKKKRIS